MKKQSVKALTMVELLATLVISSVLILMVGYLSQVAFSSHQEIRKEGDLHSDIFYGLSRISFLARKAAVLTKDTAWPNPPWVSNMLIVDNSAFGLYQPADALKKDFVFVPDNNNRALMEPVLTQADTASFTFNIDAKAADINIYGSKDKEDFSISNFIITRRN
jgi:hypothetical protein